MTRRVSLLLALLSAFMILSTAFTVYAGECSFSLSDASCENGRTFEVNLSAESQSKIASFVGEINFQSGAVEYKGAKCTDGDSLVSVNQNESGKITFVFLCEKGQSCVTDTTLITFKFKANAEGEENLTLKVWDCIDADGKDISVVVREDSSAKVTASYGGAKTNGNLSDKSHVTTADESKGESSEDSIFTRVGSSGLNPYLLFSLIAAAVVAIIIVACVFYKLGVAKSEKSLSPDGKGSEEYEEKT